MKVRKAIRKIVALGTGTLLTGATLLGAMAAADLADYPSMFIEDGKFDGLLVVGDNAAAEDVVGITNIAMSLQSVSVKKSTVSTGAAKAVVTGDSAAFERGSDFLEIGEDPGDVKGTFTSDDLLLLASGTVSTSKGTTDYNQYLKFDEPVIDAGSVIYTLNDDDEGGDFWTLTDEDVIFTYVLEFAEGLESDVDDGNLEDIEDETIHMLGSTFSITQADISGTRMTLEMLGGDVTDTMEEGETKTYTIDGTDYEVKLLIVSDTDSSVKFQINGETTDKLQEGETDRLSGGLEIGIRDVLPNEAQEEAGGDICEFYLGANKVEFDDARYEDDTNEGTVEVKEENIEDGSVEISATNVTATNAVATVVEITEISYNLTIDAAGGDPFVPAGSGLRAMLDEPQGMLTEGWDIEFHGLFAVDTSEIQFDSSGDDKYKLEFTNQAGKEYNIWFLDNSDGDFIAGKETDDYLHWTEATKDAAANPAIAFLNYSDWGVHAIDEDDTFILTDQTGDPADENDFTYVLKYESHDDDNRELSFTDESDGSTKEVIYTVDAATNLGIGTLTVAGKDFGVWVNVTDELIVVDLNGDGGDGDSVDIVTKGGAIIDLYTADADITMGAGINVTIITLASEFDGDGILGGSSNSEVNVSFVARSNQEIGISTVAANNAATDAIFNLVQPDDTDDYEYGRDPYGAFYTLYDPSGADEAEELTIEYPMEQVGASLFVVSGETSSGATGTGTVVTEEVQKISVGAVKLASEVSNVKSQNAIVVGGPCANPAASDLLGNPANCVEGFQTGHAMVRLFENSGNVAMLVAGMTAEDTRRAALVVAQYEDYELTGDEVDVTGTSLTDINVGAPVVEEEEEEAEDEEEEGGEE